MKIESEVDKGLSCFQIMRAYNAEAHVSAHARYSSSGEVSGILHTGGRFAISPNNGVDLCADDDQYRHNDTENKES